MRTQAETEARTSSHIAKPVENLFPCEKLFGGLPISSDPALKFRALIWRSLDGSIVRDAVP